MLQSRRQPGSAFKPFVFTLPLPQVNTLLLRQLLTILKVIEMEVAIIVLKTMVEVLGEEMLVSFKLSVSL